MYVYTVYRAEFWPKIGEEFGNNSKCTNGFLLWSWLLNYCTGRNHRKAYWIIRYKNVWPEAPLFHRASLFGNHPRCWVKKSASDFKTFGAYVRKTFKIRQWWDSNHLKLFRFMGFRTITIETYLYILYHMISHINTILQKISKEHHTFTKCVNHT